MPNTIDSPIGTTGDLPAQASNLDALMIEVSLAAGRGTITHDDADPELVVVRPLSSRADERYPEDEWAGHADAVIFGWLPLAVERRAAVRCGER